MKEQEDGKYLGHVACPIHGGSDSLALYEKEEGKINGYCWSECGFVSRKDLIENEVIDEQDKILVEFTHKGSGDFVMSDDIQKEVDSILELPIRGWKERLIPKFTSEFYGVRTKMDENDVVQYRYYPSTQNEELVGWHVRNDVLKQKKNRGEEVKGLPFFPIGKVRSDCEMFGQSKFQKGGKFLVIASGEEDAQAIFTAMNVEQYQRNKYQLKKFVTPVISTTVGESALKQIRNNYEWIASFEKVVIMYDNDKAGQQGSEKVAQILKPGQAKIAKYRRKDACEHLKNREDSAIVDAFWKAQEFSPAGIVGSSQTLQNLIERASFEKVPLPPFAEDLGKMFNGGFALGEICTILAGSSIGKTTISNEFVYHWVFNAPYKVGIISLESDVGELTENLMSLHTGRKLSNVDDDEKKQIYQTDDFLNKYKELTTKDGIEDRYYILDHQGAVTDGSLMKKIEYMVKGLGCKIIILDPLTLALSGKQNEGMDEFMSDLLRFVKREQVLCINVCHVRKNQSGAKANSRGAEISEEDAKGSGSIFQVSMNNILLMRDKEHEDPIVRNTTKVVVSKNRRCGNTGSAGYWFYDNYTSRLKKGGDPHNQNVSDDMKEMQELGAFDNSRPDSVISHEGENWEIES